MNQYKELNCLKCITRLLKKDYGNCLIWGKVVHMGNIRVSIIDNKVKMNFKVDEDNKIEVYN